MKKIIHFIILIVTFASCSSDNDNTASPLEKYTTYGDIHNEVLSDFIERKITFENTTRSELNHFEISKIVFTTVLQENESVLNLLTSDEIEIAISHGLQHHDKYVTRVNNDILDVENYDVSSQCKKYYNELINILEDTNNRNDLHLLIDNLANNVSESNIPQSEKDALFIGMTVGKYSFDYWSKNLQKWEDHFGSPKTRVSWARFWAMDAAGAAVGAIAGAGVGAIGGGCGASIFEGVNQLVK